MVNLSVSDAVELVRKNLDELDPNGSIMMDDENGSSASFGDNMSLNDIIARNIPEAINAVHLAAPAQLLSGVTPGFDDTTIIKAKERSLLSGDDVEILNVPFSLAANVFYLRLAAFRVIDSPVVVTDVTAEASPEGRKQLNPYLRGQYDRPRLVARQKVKYEDSGVFDYYSLNKETSSMLYDGEPYSDHPDRLIDTFLIVPKMFYDSASTQYQISPALRQNIIDYLTSIVLQTYNDQRAQVFYQKAATYMK